MNAKLYLASEVSATHRVFTAEQGRFLLEMENRLCNEPAEDKYKHPLRLPPFEFTVEDAHKIQRFLAHHFPLPPTP